VNTSLTGARHMVNMDVDWLEQTESDVPPGHEWLSGNEDILLEGLHVAKRRADWRLGRWTAKCAVAAYLKLRVPLAGLKEIEICARPSGSPQVMLATGPAPAEISLSHSGGVAVCAVTGPGAAIGCDLEMVEAHSAAFLRDFFTDQEQVEIARAPASHQRSLVATLWSAKESALKALQEGLRLDTRSVSVRLRGWAEEAHHWYPLQVHGEHGEAVVKYGQYRGLTYPRIPGHEVIGIIDRLGPGVTGRQAGQRIGVGWHGGQCGRCDSCRHGDFFACQTGQVTGISFDGGYGEYMIAPASALALVPEQLSAVEAAPLMCAGITTFNALRNSGARPGEVVAVLGLGGLGHLGVQFAVKMGFKTVVIARGKDKEPLALNLGAGQYINSQTQEPAAELAKLGGARVVVRLPIGGERP
jgi:phosphopantetheinyl transferase